MEVWCPKWSEPAIKLDAARHCCPRSSSEYKKSGPSFRMKSGPASSLKHCESLFRLNSLIVRSVADFSKGMKLHRDGNGSEFPVLEAELRRRLWWTILSLDMKVSEDRATEPTILPGAFDTIAPSNINDEDIPGRTSTSHPKARIGPTDMTCALIILDASHTARSIGFLPTQLQTDEESFESKQVLVQSCKDRIEHTYLKADDMSDQHPTIARALGRLVILRLCLMLEYPLRPQAMRKRHHDPVHVVEIVTAYLTCLLQIEAGAFGFGCTWFFRTDLPWHAIAILLVELCRSAHSPVLGQAWALIDENFPKWDERAIAIGALPLWAPIRRLLKGARDVRFQRRESQSQTAPLAESYAAQSLAGSAPAPALNKALSTTIDSTQSPAIFATDNFLDLTDGFFFDTPAGSLDADSAGLDIDWANWNDFISAFSTDTFAQYTDLNTDVPQ